MEQNKDINRIKKGFDFDKFDKLIASVLAECDLAEPTAPINSNGTELGGLTEQVDTDYAH